MPIFTKSSSLIIIVLFLALDFCGCSSRKSKSDSDVSSLFKNEQKMLGTWKLVRTEGNDIYAGPTEGTYTWMFKANRKATYLQKPKGMDGDTREVTWRLDKSNNIIFDNDTTYRVEEFGKKQMTWYNYKMAELGHSHIRVVEKK